MEEAVRATLQAQLLDRRQKLGSAMEESGEAGQLVHLLTEVDAALERLGSGEKDGDPASGRVRRPRGLGRRLPHPARPGAPPPDRHLPGSRRRPPRLPKGGAGPGRRKGKPCHVFSGDGYHRRAAER